MLANGLYNAAGLANDAAGLHVVAENAVAGGHRQRRVLRLGVAGGAAAVAVAGGAVVVVITRPGPGDGLGIIVLVIVVVSLRSRPFHRVRKRKNEIKISSGCAYPQQRESTESSLHCFEGIRIGIGIIEFLLTCFCNRHWKP